MTVLCLVNFDDGGPADASLRAVTLARSLGDTSVRTVVFADSAQVPADALAGYGVTDVYVIEPDLLDGYAPQACGPGCWPGWPPRPGRPRCWPPAPTGATRCWPTWARSPACPWRPTARSSPPTAASAPARAPPLGQAVCWEDAVMEAPAARRDPHDGSAGLG